MGSNWTRRDFLALAGAGALGAALPQWLQAADGAGESRGKLNVLFVGVDDLRCGLGCYGAEHIHSPHLDRLAQRGVLFERAYVQQAVCAASRASFLTGCRPDTTTVSYPYNDYFTKEFLPEHRTIPRFFHDRGYHCRGMGKLHHGGVLDMGVFPEPYYNGRADSVRLALPENQGKKPPTECADVPDEAYGDGALAVEAARTIHRWKDLDKPWCLSVGFYKPHLPFVAPKRYWDLYNRDDIPLSPSPNVPEGAPFYAPATWELPTYDGKLGSKGHPIDADTARLLRHGYFACTSYVDAQIGKVLAALDASGQRERTIVMFWSDHGWHLGDNGCWGKHTNFEWAARSPLIIDAPSLPRVSRGKASPALVEYVDMFPTLCEMTGQPKPGYLEGLSMTPLLQNPQRPWKSAAFSQYARWGNKPVLMGRSMRTDRYRYTEWQRTEHAAAGAEAFRGPAGSVHTRELYDHRTDPQESKNLANAPDQKQTVEELSKNLAAGWRAALPTA
jgi:iduronate 2-sulfatase